MTLYLDQKLSNACDEVGKISRKIAQEGDSSLSFVLDKGLMAIAEALNNVATAMRESRTYVASNNVPGTD